MVTIMNDNNKLRRLVHDARAPLNRISMQAELIKMLVESEASQEQLQQALDVIVNSCQECSEQLQFISNCAKEASVSPSSY